MAFYVPLFLIVLLHISFYALSYLFCLGDSSLEYVKITNHIIKETNGGYSLLNCYPKQCIIIHSLMNYLLLSRIRVGLFLGLHKKGRHYIKT